MTVRGVLFGDAQPEAVQQLIKQGRIQSGEVLEPVRVSLPNTLHQVVVVPSAATSLRVTANPSPNMTFALFVCVFFVGPGAAAFFLIILAAEQQQQLV